VYANSLKKTSGTGAVIWSKTNFGLTGHHHPRISFFPHVCTVPALLPFFKCILKVVFCIGVQHLLRFCLDNLSCVKMAVIQFYRQSGKQKSRLNGDDSNAALVNYSLVKKEIGADTLL
jgi:hypothetical protein